MGKICDGDCFNCKFDDCKVNAVEALSIGRRCPDCGAALEKFKRFCSLCAEKRVKLSTAKSHEKYNAKKKKPRYCVVCGEEVGERKKYCDKCRKERLNEYMKAYAQKAHPRICPDCGVNKLGEYAHYCPDCLRKRREKRAEVYREKDRIRKRKQREGEHNGTN